ncbi:MBL fold metallo-hydrolase [Paenibacillus sp. HB172176]|uniref:MBL fold metallo-hydrolase n=1 Tax=Paenibacillus sp. HB172176 TaxID=2493690 RepID=UPI001F0E27C1|nr:MBL fold metallo-hydrolase [Paenibacillus sp. HB172176]
MTTKGVTMLNITAEMMGGVQVIHPALIWDERDCILIDTAYPGQFGLLKAALRVAGFELDAITRILLTHQDMDHIGCLSAIVDELPHTPEIIAHEIEKPYIEGDLMLVKLTAQAIEKAVSALPEGVPVEWRTAFRHTLEHPPRGPVHKAVGDNEELPYCGGIKVIPSPGHVPGHISFYHQPSRTLIAGDALKVDDGNLLPPDPAHCSNFEQALLSISQFKRYDIKRVICFHGGMYEGRCNERIAELAQINKGTC